MSDKDAKELEHYRELKSKGLLIELLVPVNDVVYEIRRAYCYVSDGISTYRSGCCPYLKGTGDLYCQNDSCSCPDIIVQTKATLKNQKEWKQNNSFGRTIFRTKEEATKALIQKSLREGKHLDM